jgi:DNA polymerase III alpha subunit
MRIYQNYHRHGMYTNIRVPDSVVRNEDYAKRAIELGHGIISTMEHGHQGRYIEGYEYAKKYNLKFLFGSEAYWVKDRLEKDNTNAHICIFASTENGRQAINDILAEANITGFYYQPRIDLELLFSLPKNDVWITSACLAFWKYKDDTIVNQLHEYFNNNFYLEVQNHNTQVQYELNKHIIDLSNRFNIPLIMGTDSHYISEDKAWERDEYIKSKGIIYEDESGWYMDYPDGETAYQRFVKQDVLSKAQIDEAIENTNVFLTVQEYNNPCFNYDIKMPTLYLDLPQEERDQIYVNLIWEQWEKKKHKKPKEKWLDYEKEIQKEINDVLITKHADYFLDDYAIVKRGIEKGGIITDTGRGSGVSYYTNNLLGLTKIDRISAPVKMYPERFISPTRILESKSLADLDLNLANPEVFAEAQKEIMGKECSYPMIAYGTMKAKSAWKMYARAKNVEFELANTISEQIEQYENAVKHAEEDEKDEIILFDYVDEEYHELLKDSEKYLGIVSDIKPHPCAYLIYQGNIRKEIGLINIKAKSGKKEILCTIMDGKWAEEYKFFKNDLLKVNVVELIKKVYQRISIEPHDEPELISLCKNNQKVWDVYKNGWVMGINQVEQNATKHRVMKYKPTNISELCAFVAAIRPGFKSMYSTFEKREPFSYGIPAFDQLIQTEEMPNSFLLYQEMAMAALNFAGVPMSECYDVIKNIAKKRAEKVKKYKDQFSDGFKARLIDIEHVSEEEAQSTTEKVWQIINDSCRYSFNASHSYSVAMDSLYGAYLKSHYPLQFYEVFLNILNDKSDKDRMTEARKEAESAYRIRFEPLRFRQDNRKITVSETNSAIWNSLKALKGFGEGLANQFYELKDNVYNSFIDLLIEFEENGIMCSKIEDLIKIQYFNEFGNNGKLLAIYKEFTEGKNRYDKKHVEKTKIKRIESLREYEISLPDTQIPINEQMIIERELLGYVQVTLDVDKRYIFVMDVETKFSPRIEIYCLANGKSESMKIQKKLFNNRSFNVGDILYLKTCKSKLQTKFENGKFVQVPDTKEWWIEDYDIVTEKFKQ